MVFIRTGYICWYNGQFICGIMNYLSNFFQRWNRSWFLERGLFQMVVTEVVQKFWIFCYYMRDKIKRCIKVIVDCLYVTRQSMVTSKLGAAWGKFDFIVMKTCSWSKVSCWCDSVGHFKWVLSFLWLWVWWSL